MKSLSFKKIEKILISNGFVFTRQNGSHKVYRNVKDSTSMIIAFHGKNKDVPIGTFKSIIKQSKLPKDKWFLS